tara:strand:+ start:2229 stop:2564 length:336 start_codon:yes stop_codon:yes gene_type:complete
MKLKLQRQVQALRIASDTILNKYQKYYGFIYSDKSNEIFDEEHDSAYYNLQGFKQTYNELQDDIEIAEEVLSPMAIDKWFSLLKEDVKCLNEIEKYYNAVVKAKKPNYIYG